MFYQKEIRIPANTSAKSPVVRRLRVYPGIASHIWVGFPRGCYGLAHIQIWHHGWQVWPWTPQESYHWNDYVFDIDDRYPLEGEPYEFVVKAWNLDDTFSHSPFFAVTVEHAPKKQERATLVRRLSELGIKVV